MMIKTYYMELPFEKRSYLIRPEFSRGQEQSFHDALKDSMIKYGMKDPVYLHYHGPNYGPHLKVIVGNNRMVVAKELGIKIIKAIVTNFKADEYPLDGQLLTTDKQIRSFFVLPNDLQIRRDKNGNIDQVTPPYYNNPEIREQYV